MKLLDDVKQKIDYLGTSSGAFILAHAAWSACDHRELLAPSALKISVAMDSSNVEIVSRLQQITTCHDYSNSDQAEMLRWLDSNGYSDYVAKQVKLTKKKLVDWA